MSGINDYQTARNWKRHFIPANAFHFSFEGEMDAIPPTDTAVVVDAISTAQGSATPADLLQISTLGYVGVRMDTAGQVVDCLAVLQDIDASYPMYARVWWTSGSTTTADTVTWKVFRKRFTANSSELAAPDGALDTAIAQDTVPSATAYTLAVTAAGKWAAATQPTDLFFGFRVEMDAKAVGLTEPLLFVGLELCYAPHLLGTGYGQGAMPELPSGWS